MSKHEFAWLKGATVEKVGNGSPVGWDETKATKFTFRLPEPIELNGEEASVVELEVWQDEEGNGAGYLALVKHS